MTNMRILSLGARRGPRGHRITANQQADMITPAFQDDSVTVYLGDCLEVLTTWTDKAADQ